MKNEYASNFLSNYLCDSVSDDDGLRQLVVPSLPSAVPQHPYNSQPEEQNGERVSDNMAQQRGLIIQGAAVNSHHTNAYETFAETLTASHIEIDVVEKDHDGVRGRRGRPAPFDIYGQHQRQGGGQQRQYVIEQERAATRPPVCQSQFDFLHYETTNLSVVSPSLSSSPLTRT